MLKLNLSVVTCIALLASSGLGMAPAHAQFRSRLHTSTGPSAYHGIDNSYPAGGCIRGGRFGASRGRACAIQRENGSTTRASGSAEGIGAFRRVNRSYTNPTTGNTVSGSVNSRYNAQTGAGTRASDRSGTVNGKTYDYQTNTNYQYTRGSGVTGTTSIDTLNHGTFNCTYTTGSGKSCTNP